MKRLGCILVFLVLLAATAWSAPDGVARCERTFADAAKAYDDNRLPEAIAGWQALADEGVISPRDLELLTFVETADEAWDHVCRHADETAKAA